MGDKHIPSGISGNREHANGFLPALVQAPIGIMHTALDGTFLWVNDRFGEMLGYGSHELTGSTFMKFTHPEDVGADDAARHDLISGALKHYSTEKRYIHKDGRFVWVSLNVSLIRDTHGQPECYAAFATDITPRKTGEEERGEEGRRVAEMIAAAVDAIIMIDGEECITLFNASAARMFRCGAPDAIGEKIGIFIPERFHEIYSSHIRALGQPNAAGRPRGIMGAVSALRTNGEEFPVEASISQIEINGRRHYAIILRDITIRRRAEETAKRLSAIVEYSDDAIISKTLDGIITSWNPAAEKMFGYAASEIVGHPVTVLIPPGHMHEEQEILTCIGGGGGLRNFETVRMRRDGQLVDVSITISPIKDAAGQVIGASKIVRDITEHMHDVQRIAEQAALLDKAQDAILVYDMEGRVLFWSKGAERLYGWTKEEMLGREVSTLLYENDTVKYEEARRAVLKDDEWSGELRRVTKSGGKVIVEARWTLLRDPAGNPKSILAINTDVTERKRIEAQFMRAQRMEGIGVLAGGVAHDLNNILAPILLAIQILEEAIDDPQKKQILETIETSARRGADIVRQILSFARGMEMQSVEVQPGKLLREIEHIIRNTFPKNIRLDYSIPQDTWRVMGDPTQLHQILLNLSVNARDAMPNGGVLSFALENRVLDEQYAMMDIHAKAGPYVVISVTDTGTGMPPGIIERIFDPFFTTKEIGHGTGLGLSTALAIIKSHEGFLNVYSEPGRGTTFRVCLPAITTIAQPGSEEEASQLPRGNGETVLVVDDEAPILSITGKTLQAYGYRVLTADNGAEAVAVYARHMEEVAVVLTDMMMPVMDGTATIHALLKLNPSLKIIAASGLNANENVTRAANAGIKHFLAKPYSAATLLKMLRSVLDGNA